MNMKEQSLSAAEAKQIELEQDEVNEFGFTQYDVEYTRSNLGPLLRYLDDPDVYEIRINKFGQVVCATVSGNYLHDDENITEKYLNGLTDHLLHLNRLARKPINNVVLPDGSRGVFCWSPAVLDGTVLIAIRKHLPITKSLDQLSSEGRFKRAKHRTFSDEKELRPVEKELLELLAEGRIADFLTLAVRSKLNIAVAGATGSGKTVLTRALLRAVPKHERVLLMQDTHEVSDDHLDEIGYMLYGDDGDQGRLTPAQCLKACMRLSPDRIFLTELRGDAAWDYLASTSTGHPGSIFSLHAEDGPGTYIRIAELVKQSPVGRLLDYELIMNKIRSTVDVVVHMEKREITEILYDPLGKRAAKYAV